MILLIGAVYAAGLAIIVRVIKFYRHGDILRALFWMVGLVALVELIRLVK